jgi:hypothetical protein
VYLDVGLHPTVALFRVAGQPEVQEFLLALLDDLRVHVERHRDLRHRNADLRGVVLLVDHFDVLAVGNTRPDLLRIQHERPHLVRTRRYTEFSVEFHVFS